MRNRFAPLRSFILAFTALLAACGGSSGGDPYELLSTSTKTAWDPIQVNIGFAAKDGSTTVTVDPSSIGIVIDSAGGTGALHVSIPTAGLELDPVALSQLGITGDSLDVDIVYDGDALYGRSPLLGTVVLMLLAQSGEVPSGDLTGWLRIATADDLAGLASAFGGSGTIPTATMPPAGDAKELKQALEGAGITVSTAGTEQHNGADAHHLKVAIDAEKLLASDYFDTVSRVELEQARAALEAVTLAVDLWIDKASNHLVEIAAHVTSKSDSSQTAEILVRFSDPDGSVETEAPADFVEIPVDALVTNLMQLIGQGLIGG